MIRKKYIFMTLFTVLFWAPLSALEKPHKEYSSHKRHAEDLPAENKNHDDHDEHQEHKKNHGAPEDGDKHESHGSQKAIGHGKAIITFQKERGIKFSKAAYKTMGLELVEIKSSPFVIPDSGLVRKRKHHGVFMYKDGFFKLVHVKVLRKLDGGRKFMVDPRRKVHIPGSMVLTNNANLVRVAIIYAQDTGKYSHSH